jgi:penicillin-binding protein 2
VAEQALGTLDGAAVALDPRNGEVLALVSKPGFDPGPFVEGIDNASYHALLDDADRPLYNRALLGAYPPGSTIKPFMAVAGLINGTLNPATRIFDPGFFMLPGSDHRYRCWKRHGHGWVDLDDAIQKSCDVYFYQAALNMGIDRIDRVLTEFGFGQATGIDVPSERSGLLPSVDWKRRTYHQVWFPGETLNTGIGQGYVMVTPVQLAQAVARLAMRGGGFKPHLVHAMEDPNTHNMTAVEPEAEAVPTRRDPAPYERVISAMARVTQMQGGTAYAVFKDAPYTVAGKTGSAQVAGLSQHEEDAPKQDTVPLQLRDHALFIAFAPVDQPQIAVAVVAEHGAHGASAAAPVARMLIDQYLLGKVLYNAKAAPPPPPAAPEPAEPADSQDEPDVPDDQPAPAAEQPAPIDNSGVVPPR